MPSTATAARSPSRRISPTRSRCRGSGAPDGRLGPLVRARARLRGRAHPRRRRCRAFMDKFAAGGPQSTASAAVVRDGRGHAGGHLRRSRRRRCSTDASNLTTCSGRESDGRDQRHARGDRLVRPPLPRHQVEIVDDKGTLLGERKVGEIVVAGPSVAKGYFGDEATSQATFRGGRLFTGDLGYLRRRASSTSAGAAKTSSSCGAATTTRRTSRRSSPRSKGARPRRWRCSPARARGNAHAGNGATGTARALGGDERLVAVAEVSKAQFAEDAVRQRDRGRGARADGARVDEVHLLSPRSAPQNFERQSSTDEKPERDFRREPSPWRRVARSKRGIDQRRGSGLVRRLERVLPPLAGRADELHERRLRDARAIARSRAAQQARASWPTSRTSRPSEGARHRLRLGREPRVPGHHARREERVRHHALQRADGRDQPPQDPRREGVLLRLQGPRARGEVRRGRCRSA